MRHRKRASSAEVYRLGWRAGYRAVLIARGLRFTEDMIPEPPDRREGPPEDSEVKGHADGT